MYGWHLLVIILFVVEASSLKNWFYFDIDEENLALCVETNVLIYSHDLNHDIQLSIHRGLARRIAEVVSKRYSMKICNRHALNCGIGKLIPMFLGERPRSDQPNHLDVKWKSQKFELSNAIRYALEMCSGDKNNYKAYIKPLPVFPGESIEYSVLLDYILVDWPHSLKDMVESELDRALLRRFAHDALIWLRCTLDSAASIDSFRHDLRAFWIRRSQLYYDGQNSYSLYIPHRFTWNNLIPYTYVNVNLFGRRNYSDPLLPPIYLDLILNRHAANRPGDEGSEVFSEYITRGRMTSAEYHIENHIDQFYRILFWFIELSSWHNAWNTDLPILAILDNDDAYRDYLLTKRDIEADENSSNEYRRNLARTAGVREEDLLLLMMNTPSTSGVTRAATTSSTTSSTLAFSSTAQTSPKYDEPKSDNQGTFGTKRSNPYSDDQRNYDKKSKKSETWDFSNFFPDYSMDTCLKLPLVNPKESSFLDKVLDTSSIFPESAHLLETCNSPSVANGDLKWGLPDDDSFFLVKTSIA